jgi:antitoxin component of RelBE/YafQ-DinJ toxin-antitoxin module
MVEPADIPVTTPNEFTVATAVFAEDHVTVLSVALDGKTVAANDFVTPIFRVHDVGEILTDVADTVIVSVHDAVILPLTVVARITALPAETAVTSPDELTLALAELELHTTVLSVALDGVIAVVSVSVLVG